MRGLKKSWFGLGISLAVMTTSAYAANVFTDTFSNIPGWERRGVVVNYGLQWEGTMLQDPSVLYNQGGGAPFKMWYGAATRIGYAESNDGISWTKFANPVLVAGANGATDDAWLTVPSVVYNGGVYHMTYCGNDGAVARIHYATATSPGGPWTKRGVILAPNAAYEDNFLYNSSLMFDGQWKMWYTAGKIASAGGEPEFIAYATASNPAGPWTKYSGNPILRPMGDGGWLHLGIGGPNVMKKNGVYHMVMLGWQADYPSRGGRLISADGVNWTVNREKMHYDLGTVGTWEDSMIYRQYLVDVNGREYMYYNAKDTQPGWNERIGLAIWNTNLPIVDPAKWIKTFGRNAAGGGTFSIDAGRLRTLGLAPVGASQVLQGNVRVNSANYSLSADVTPTSSIDAQKDNVLHVRALDLRNYYYGGIASWGGKYAIGKIVGGVNTRLNSTGATSQILPNTTYRLRLSVSGSTIQLYDNGVLVLSAVDTSLNPASSYVALETVASNGQAFFDNVSVDTDSATPTYFNGFESSNVAGNRIRHLNSRGRVDPNVTPAQDGQWRMIPGLANPLAVSFESVNFPGRYLRHRNGEVWMDPNDSSALFHADATWHRRAGLANGAQVSFESYNFPGRYIRHRDSLLYSESVIDALGRSDATFIQR